MDGDYDGDYMPTKKKQVPRRVLPSYKFVNKEVRKEKVARMKGLW